MAFVEAIFPLFSRVVAQQVFLVFLESLVLTGRGQSFFFFASMFKTDWNKRHFTPRSEEEEAREDPSKKENLRDKKRDIQKQNTKESNNLRNKTRYTKKKSLF